jgi:hypothetical protein
MSALLSLLGLETRSDAEKLAALQRTCAGTWDVERVPCGYRAWYLLEVREPVTARTPAALSAAMAAARGCGGAPAGRPAPW